MNLSVCLIQISRKFCALRHIVNDMNYLKYEPINTNGKILFSLAATNSKKKVSEYYIRAFLFHNFLILSSGYVIYMSVY